MNEEQNFQLSREWDAIQKTTIWRILNAHILKMIESRQDTCRTTRPIDQEKIVTLARAQGELEMLREVLRYPDRAIKGNISAS